MAAPDLDDAAFPDGLHTSTGKTDKGTVTGKGLKKDQPVKVTGHSGKKPYVWTGKVGDPTDVKDTWYVSVTLLHTKKRTAEEKKDRDTEDVSTTVTNASSEESQPVNTAAVRLVA